MITAVDSPVLLDVLVPEAEHGAESEQRLAKAAEAGALVISPTVVAELGAYFNREFELKLFLRDTGLKLVPFGLASLHMAGQTWKAYQRKGGAPLNGRQQQVVADFLVGAHAMVHAERLLTRDRGFYRACFPKLKLGP
ncbi:MAG TPA: type II toxin-antitoxin system VapC family toxin [Terriglobales bacterium]|nr:type II toxin-antitoxin system VapC family toxin [Terriglobales bacterium]